MLKRLFWLSLFCAAFLLLLGLMVQEGEVQQPQPARVQAFFALMPAPSGDTREAPAPASAGLLHEDSFPGSRLKATPAGITVAARPYHERVFQAFHYPDEAG